MKNDFIKLIEQEIEFEPDFNDIKNQIKTNKYISQNKLNKNKILFKYSFITISIILIMVLGIFLSPTRYRYKDINKLIYYNDYELIEAYDNVMMVQIVDEIETKNYDGTGMDIPYTFYSYKIIKILKGEQVFNQSRICFYGGKKSIKETVLLRNNNELFEINEVYLIFSNKKNINSNNERIEENDLIISDNEQKILLKDYNMLLSFDEQELSINYIINRYQNIINKEIGNNYLDIIIPQTIEELVNNNDYVSIIKIENERIREQYNYGLGSDVASTSYRIKIIQNFKNSDLSEVLYCYGTNFWENDKKFENYVSKLEKGGIYLVIANKKNKDCENNLISENDLVVMDNIQLVKLDGYDIEKNYTKQSEQIIKNVEEYIQFIK